ncbi:MAG: hypothetical protein Ta2A_22310 [Treponemataceae bacterium]|nr:MAG: hypothetical protein Ta2A_22310 [Treponemataceae bacterium]
MRFVPKGCIPTDAALACVSLGAEKGYAPLSAIPREKQHTPLLAAGLLILQTFSKHNAPDKPAKDDTQYCSIYKVCTQRQHDALHVILL